MRKQLEQLENIFLFLTIFLLPTYLIRFQIGLLPTNLLEVLAAISISLAIFNSKQNLDWKIIEAYRFPLILLFFGLSVSSVINQNYLSELGIIKSWFLMPFFFSFLSIQRLYQKKWLILAIKTLFFSSLLLSFISLLYFFTGNITYDNRLTAFYSSPNYLAMFLAPGFIIGTLLIFIERKKLPWIMWTFLIATVIFLTKSYSTWITIIFSLILINLITRNSYAKKMIIFLIIASILMLSFQWKSTKLHDALTINERSSLSSRIMIWQSSAHILKDNLVLGIGPGNFQEKYLSYQKYFPPYLEWAVPQPHNLFLAFWLQTSIFGLGGFISLLYLWIRNLIVFIHKRKSGIAAAHISLVIMLYTLLHGLVDTPYWKNDLAYLFWITIFLGIYGVKVNPKDQADKSCCLGD